MWIVTHACPLLCTRDPDVVGPHAAARIVVCALFEGAFVVFAALVSPNDDATPPMYGMNASFASQAAVGEEASRIMAWRICLPALCVALVALATFFVAMEPRYRRTFFVRDTRQAMYLRYWAAWAEGAHCDEDRAHIVGDGSAQLYVGEPVVLWIEQRATCWAQSPPAWWVVHVGVADGSA
jgi:hypothetical protein